MKRDFKGAGRLSGLDFGVRAIAALALLATPSVSASAVAPADTAPTYSDTNLTPEQRAKDLVGRMTLEEKSLQLGHAAPAIPRLGVPQYNWWNEGLHGVARAGIATVYPQAIGMAASWNAPLMEQVGDAVSTEFRAKYLERVHPDGGAEFYRGLTVWSPNVNIFRDPRWGRGQETYGEDPYLTGRMGIAYIHGLQGHDAKYLKTIATSKHFAVHSGPESNRHREDVHPSAHDLEDTYLPAFRATVTEGGAQSVMCVYNAVYGVPGCASDLLLSRTLRRDWGFKGYVVSDCGAVANVYREDSLHYTKTAPEGVAASLKAGTDLICGDYRNNMTTEPENIVAAVRAGLMPEATVDQALERLFTARIRLGLFDPRGTVFPGITAQDYNTPDHRALSLQMAKDSMVLLKNHGDLLPLSTPPKTIAVIGPNADSYDVLVGNYYGRPTKPVTVLDGVRARFPASKVLFAEGSGLIGPAEEPVPDSALCADGDCATKGLKASYFSGPAFSGTEAVRVEPNARVSWSGEDKNASARWTGYLTAPETGEYRLRFASENGYRIWIDDQLIVDEWQVGDAPSIASGRVKLKAGQRYALRVDAVQRDATGDQRLVWSRPSANGDDAVAAARQADVVIFVGGLSARIEGEEMKVEADGFAGGDRTSLDLPAPQQKLLERIHATGKPVVLVLMNGSPLSVTWADKNVPAIVEAWYPGGEGGAAVAALLSGDFSPAGRLPITFHRSADDLPPFGDYAMTGRTYRYFKKPVLYPFGHGLSFTKFVYDAPTASSAAIKAGAAVQVSVRVANTGGRDGDEVVQLYVEKPGDKAAPTLAGFTRIHLTAGESRLVTFDLDARRLSQVDDHGVRKVVPGSYTVHLGGGQPGHAKTVKLGLSVTGEDILPH
ncbi:glycoside hydrolase family 3 protein [Caulobacter sp. RL271]|jgi:beta-glucosidase|uniref:Glycoside hydrolase family 3 C-terminal domain-containing protein n=1 Tax=Caulobacter segnis TaxID=88688 RepID=A0ABY5A0A8_9CAUL|nr:glycoside hydrolase family 3 protein [Caulobacter segnis]USQ98034.1 glycoside hydrolase family 3 C-terminal domain-containing protein [Caulobacter segnis]